MREYLMHHGILGQKWGIRRYQNEDGTLTEEGRKRLGIDKYEKDHDSDINLKKGTKASRVVGTSQYYEYADPEVGGSKKAAKKYLDDIAANEANLDRKYISVDNVRNSGRENGKDFYTAWFTDLGWAPESAYIDMYELKNDARVASGKKVMDALLEEVGSQKVSELLKNDQSIWSLTLEYTGNKDLYDKVNDRFKKEGYDGIEDINDPSTDMPILMFNSKKNLGKPVSRQTGEEALKELYKKRKADSDSIGWTMEEASKWKTKSGG